MLENRKTQKISIWQINKKLWLEIKFVSFIFGNKKKSLHYCSQSISRDEAFIPQLFISMKFEENFSI